MLALHDQADDSHTPNGRDGTPLAAPLGYIDKSELRRDPVVLSEDEETKLTQRAELDPFWTLFKKAFGSCFNYFQSRARFLFQRKTTRGT